MNKTETGFKYLTGKHRGLNISGAMEEIAYQLKRIADDLSDIAALKRGGC